MAHSVYQLFMASLEFILFPATCPFKKFPATLQPEVGDAVKTHNLSQHVCAQSCVFTTIGLRKINAVWISFLPATDNVFRCIVCYLFLGNAFSGSAGTSFTPHIITASPSEVCQQCKLKQPHNGRNQAARTLLDWREFT